VSEIVGEWDADGTAEDAYESCGGGIFPNSRQ